MNLQSNKTEKFPLWLRKKDSYLWPDRQYRSLRLNCRTTHLHRTCHTHPLLCQSAAHHHSQIADRRQAAHLKRCEAECEITSALWHALSCWIISTWHVPLKQAAVEPNEGELSDSQRVPSTNWEPRLTMKFSPSDWHMYRHCSSPGYDEKISQKKKLMLEVKALHCFMCMEAFLFAHLV